MSDSIRLALIIGMDVYRSKDLKPLPSCKKDAIDLCSLLSEMDYTVFGGSPIIGSEIIEDETGFIKINDAIRKFFNEGKPSQTLIFYFSGHGIDDKNEVYLATPHVDPKNPDPYRTIPALELTKLMKQSKSKRIVAIIDACFSGSLDLPQSEQKKASKDSAKRALATYGRVWKSIPKTKNLFLLLSSQSYESSRVKENDNSYYTKYLLEGLRGVKCDIGPDGKPAEGSIDLHGDVTANSLHNYVYFKVANELKDQTPELKSDSSTDIVLASYPQLVKTDEAWSLIKKLDNVDLTHLDRQIIGDQLEKTGDPRQGVGIRADGLPDICWKRVLSGQVAISVSDQISIKELTQKVEPFFIAAYPVTVAQYKCFLRERVDFESILWWSSLRKTSYALMLEKLSIQRANYPVTEVNWHEAVAFCRWLNAQNQGQRLDHEEVPEKTFVIGENVVVRLPTVWEWVQAATGGYSENRYPWGEHPDERKANTANSGLGRSIAVGMYPAGKTVDGVMDMLGNVSEWCLNEFDENLPNPFQNMGAAPEQSLRIVFGGSWQTNFNTVTERYARSARSSLTSNNHRGFRIAIGSDLK